MMNVRSKVFETNSSSSHSVTVTNDVDLFEYVEVDFGGSSFQIQSGEFGWGPESFSDAKTKMSYAYTYILELKKIFEVSFFNSQDEIDQKKLVEMTKKIQKCKQMLTRVVKEYLRVDHVFFKDKIDEYVGYIDHQSSPSEDDWFFSFFSSDESLKNFLFNKNHILEIDNDNH